MIFLFTDFGYNGPYVGQMKTVLAVQAHDMPVIDLMHDAPACNPRATAYLLASLSQFLPENAVTIAVIDPGVGSDTRQPSVLHADGKWYVGPNNGLFNVLACRAKEYRIWQIDWRPDRLSSSFHGRDLFAPVAIRIAQGNHKDLTQTRLYAGDCSWPADLPEIIYIDDFGNCMTGLRATEMSRENLLEVKDETFSYAQTFSAVAEGLRFWYENSNGLVELAINQGKLARLSGLNIGDKIKIKS